MYCCAHCQYPKAWGNIHLWVNRLIVNFTSSCVNIQTQTHISLPAVFFVRQSLLEMTKSWTPDQAFTNRNSLSDKFIRQFTVWNVQNSIDGNVIVKFFLHSLKQARANIKIEKFWLTAVAAQITRASCRRCTWKRDFLIFCIQSASKSLQSAAVLRQLIVGKVLGALRWMDGGLCCCSFRSSRASCLSCCVTALLCLSLFRLQRIDVKHRIFQLGRNTFTLLLPLSVRYRIPFTSVLRSNGFFNGSCSSLITWHWNCPVVASKADTRLLPQSATSSDPPGAESRVMRPPGTWTMPRGLMNWPSWCPATEKVQWNVTSCLAFVSWYSRVVDNASNKV